MEIGKRLRETRIRQGKVIDDVAGASGLSRAYISQVETGKASPTIQTVSKLAAALDIPMSSLFVEEEAGCTVIRATDRQNVHFGEPEGPHRKLLQFMSAPNRQLELVMIEIPPYSTAIDRAHVHEGEEACHVLEGRIEVIYGNERYTLEPGDSIHWDSRIAHMIRNVGAKPTRLIVARTPGGLMDLRFDDWPAPEAAEESRDAN